MLGIGEAAFDSFFASLVERFSRGGFAVEIDLFTVLFPNMPGDGFDVLGITGALSQQRTLLTYLWIGAVFPIALPVGRAVAQTLSVGTYIAVVLGIVKVEPFGQAPLNVGGAAVADDPIEVALLQSFAKRRSHVASIEADGLGSKAETLSLSVQTLQVGDAVMYIAGSDMGIGDQVVLTAGGAMVEIEKTFGLAVADHVSTIGVGSALFDLFAGWLLGFGF